MQNLLRSKIFLIALLIYAGAFQSLHSQLWERVGKFDHFVTGLWPSIESNRLYITGSFPHADTLLCKGICIWDGLKFSKIIPPPTACNLCGTGNLLKYANKIFATGQYNLNNRSEGLIEFDNNEWKSSASFVGNYGPGSIQIVNNKLFLLGFFDTISNIKANCIAIYNPAINNWDRFSNNEPFITTQNDLDAMLTSVVFYKNEYYFGGNINRVDDFKEILRYDGQNWKPLQKGVFGSNADAGGLIVYQNILYVTGYFFKKDGNAADYIMAWDGESWFNPFPQIQYLGGAGSRGIQGMTEINGQLYLSGNFVIPSDNDSLAYGLARFDGCNFSAFGVKLKYPEELESPAQIAGFKGKIYAAVRDTFQKKYAGYLITFDESLPNFRTVNISFCPEVSDTVLSLNLFPNPFSEKIILNTTKFTENVELKIFDMLGRSVYSSYFDLKEQIEFDLPQLTSGVYFATVKANGKFLIKKKIVRL